MPRCYFPDMAKVTAIHEKNKSNKDKFEFFHISSCIKCVKQNLKRPITYNRSLPICLYLLKESPSIVQEPEIHLQQEMSQKITQH